MSDTLKQSEHSSGNYDSGFASYSASTPSSPPSCDSNSNNAQPSPAPGLEPGLDWEKVYRRLVEDCRSWDSRDIQKCLKGKPAQLAEEALWKNIDEDGDFEAICAAANGEDKLVNFAVLIAQNYKLYNTQCNAGSTVLHMAAEKCTADTVRNLITKGANGAIADCWGNTPLHIAARHGRVEVVHALTTSLTRSETDHLYFKAPYKSLPQQNVQTHNHDGMAPIHLAADNAHHDVLRELVRTARADINQRRMGDGWSPAHIAINNGDIHTLMVCLELGSDSEVRDYGGFTPMQLAANRQRDDMVWLCQQYGASSNQLDSIEIECDDDSSDYSEESDMECEDYRSNHLIESIQAMAVQ